MEQGRRPSSRGARVRRSIRSPVPRVEGQTERQETVPSSVVVGLDTWSLGRKQEERHVPAYERMKQKCGTPSKRAVRKHEEQWDRWQKQRSNASTHRHYANPHLSPPGRSRAVRRLPECRLGHNPARLHAHRPHYARPVNHHDAVSIDRPEIPRGSGTPRRPNPRDAGPRSAPPRGGVREAQFHSARPLTPGCRSIPRTPARLALADRAAPSESPAAARGTGCVSDGRQEDQDDGPVSCVTSDTTPLFVDGNVKSGAGCLTGPVPGAIARLPCPPVPAPRA